MISKNILLSLSLLLGTVAMNYCNKPEFTPKASQRPIREELLESSVKYMRTTEGFMASVFSAAIIGPKRLGTIAVAATVAAYHKEIWEASKELREQLAEYQTNEDPEALKDQELNK